MAAGGENRWPPLCSCRLPQGMGLCCVSRAGLFLPRTTAALAWPWALPSCPARRRGAVPGCETTPAWTCQARTSLISVVDD